MPRLAPSQRVQMIDVIMLLTKGQSTSAALWDLEHALDHFFKLNPVNHFYFKGSELDLIGCNPLHISPTFSLGVKDTALYIYLERLPR